MRQRRPTPTLWIDGLTAADQFGALEPFFYLVLTSVDPNDYRWDGAKPLRNF